MNNFFFGGGLINIYLFFCYIWVIGFFLKFLFERFNIILYLLFFKNNWNKFDIKIMIIDGLFGLFDSVLIYFGILNIFFK